jgi:alkanesulfonate monooxygenase SsuD/methylene tetrahydromethanopterin reductase-like flavin-dependent oxidoreductase (luciferase family)
MRLALNLGYWAGDVQSNSANIELSLEAERLGYESVWAAEAYGSDAATVLSWIGARTSHWFRFGDLPNSRAFTRSHRHDRSHP